MKTVPFPGERSMENPTLYVRKIRGILVVSFGPHAAGEPVSPEVGLTRLCQENPGVILDLPGLSFLTSELIGKLILLNRAIAGTGNRIRICCPSDPVREAMILTRIDQVLPLFATLAEALADFEEPID